MHFHSVTSQDGTITIDFDLGHLYLTATTQEDSMTSIDEYGRYRTRFAPVCGIQMYEQMAIRNKLPNYHLLLTHDILAKPDRYAAVFRNMVEYQNRCIILDNSVVELEHPLGIQDVKEAADIVQANVIVLPDVYRDGEATADSCRTAYRPWEEALSGIFPEDHNWSFMYVPQGRTLQEYAKSAQAMESNAEFPRIEWWGVARNMVEHVGSRQKPLEICNILNGRRHIHMLGFSDDLIDDVLTVRKSGYLVAGIDSAVPLRCDEPFTLTTTVGKRDPKWLDEAEYNDFVQDNIEAATRLFSGTGRG
jgi:hypothetical protein